MNSQNEILQTEIGQGPVGLNGLEDGDFGGYAKIEDQLALIEANGRDNGNVLRLSADSSIVVAIERRGDDESTMNNRLM